MSEFLILYKSANLKKIQKFKGHKITVLIDREVSRKKKTLDTKETKFVKTHIQKDFPQINFGGTLASYQLQQVPTQPPPNSLMPNNVQPSEQSGFGC